MNPNAGRTVDEEAIELRHRQLAPSSRTRSPGSRVSLTVEGPRQMWRRTSSVWVGSAAPVVGASGGRRAFNERTSMGPERRRPCPPERTSPRTSPSCGRAAVPCAASAPASARHLIRSRRGAGPSGMGRRAEQPMLVQDGPSLGVRTAPLGETSAFFRQVRGLQAILTRTTLGRFILVTSCLVTHG